ncbi:hypothetical protein BKA66DRAFT_421564 [Pyrenochaeta sp. MPI-SDFR-AT-0127]|nr:hypothetical protein BKA66DRAFT_421564 [Pyrenochaeta sp. MPI-SDFR-AT-0127]
MVDGYTSRILKAEHLGDLFSSLSVGASDKPNPSIPLTRVATDGWSEDDEATATCYCGAVQLDFVTGKKGLVNSFVCNYPDSRKLTASKFTSAFIVNDRYLKHLRGQSNLKAYAQNASIASHTLMMNHFCDTGWTLMYRVAERLPGHSLVRLGAVDNFNLAETKPRPRTEVFIKYRVGWFLGVPREGVKRHDVSPA